MSIFAFLEGMTMNEDKYASRKNEKVLKETMPRETYVRCYSLEEIRKVKEDVLKKYGHTPPVVLKSIEGVICACYTVRE